MYCGAGYTTGMFGKWHLGTGDEYHPTRRGFDEAIVTQGGHFAPDYLVVPPPGSAAVDAAEGEYLARFLTDRAVDFIARHAAASHQGRPFFLYLPHFAVHTPIQAPDETVARFADKPPVGGHHYATYAGMVAEVDDSVGRVVAALQQHGLTANTLVLFSSDNGGHGGYGALGTSIDDRSAGTVRNITDNAPLRGGKGMLYEGGVRVPLIAKWPGHIRPATTCREPVISVDLLPTLATLAGARHDASIERDGVSLVPLFAETDTDLGRDALYWHFPGYLQANEDEGTWRTTPAGAIRVGSYKLIEFFEDGRLELYDLAADLGQQHDLAPSEPALVARLHDKLVAWRRQVDAPMPHAK
ncbi:MAG: sulfatase-like hydrolase/transferase [Pirellulales bacterium]